MVRTIQLTPEELCECVCELAGQEIGTGRAYLSEFVEFVTTADGVAAVVTFADKDAPRPPSVIPRGGKPLTNTTQDVDELEFGEKK